MDPVPERARVVIVGGGFAGAATAFHLAQAGVRDVIILEREATCGYHASGRNAGLCRQITDDDVVTGLAIAGAEFLRRPPPAVATAPLLDQTGSLLISAHPAVLDTLAARAARRDLPHERLALERVLGRWPRLTGVPAAGAVWFPTDGVIDIHRLLSGFMNAARAGGARVFQSAEVRRFRPGWGSVTVETSRGNVTAEFVVNAAGAWAGEMGRRAGAAPLDLVSLHRHLFLTERVPGMDRRAPFAWFIDQEEMYVRPEESGYLISPCDASRSDPCDARVAPDAAAILGDRLRRVAPWLADLSVARSWACLRTFAADQRPVVGWDPDAPWLFWVAGLGGHGATTCAAVGRLAAADLGSRLTGR
jgi:glycine/D-amino acid oxidase-like deaminating enzyme